MAKKHYIYDLEAYYDTIGWKSIMTCTTKEFAIKKMKMLSDLHKSREYRIIAYQGYSGIYLGEYIIDKNLNKIML